MNEGLTEPRPTGQPSERPDGADAPPSPLAMAALDYLRRGHRLLALTGKRPNPRFHREWSWDRSFHGVPQTAEQVASVEQAFDFFFSGTTGIAILIPPHVLVADIDTEEAAALFKDLAGKPSGTAIARTTKGLHVWYLAPGEAASRWLGGRTLLLKGHGGYVAVEPSAHFTDDTLRERDGTYTWVSDISDGIGWLPDGIAAMLQAEALRESLKPESDNDMVSIRLQFAADGRWEGMYPAWDTEALERTIEQAADGNQNNVIHWAACVARDGGVPYEVSMDRLLAAALRGHHPRSRAFSTIRGAYKRRRG